ncbi:MAG: tRNA lysidine(34) synthetase TilS [Sulfobacillus thermotolerans]|nr:tRNA lysidine(34) synthetase TilS [Sulfobacillus thermotolerans]
MMGVLSIEQRFLDTARRLWAPGATIIVGVSGGADSLALLFLLARINPQWPVTLQPVHVDHNLRPDSADDAAWVQQVVRDRLGMDVVVEAIHIVRERGESWEMAARRERYRILRSYRQQAGPDAWIAVAHHQRDQAETVLMRLITGTGIQGLQGMREKTQDIVRPLLTFSPGSLRDYLQAHDVSWREDPTNQDPYWLRNRIRWQLLPLLQTRFNPQIETTLAQLAERAQEEYQVIAQSSEQFLISWNIDVRADPLLLPKAFGLLLPAVQADVMRRIGQVRGLRLSQKHIRQARDGIAQWPKRFRVWQNAQGDWLIAGDSAAIHTLWPSHELPLQGSLMLPGGRLVVSQTFYKEPQASATFINADRWSALKVRAWRPGDRIEPLGMAGHHKKLQDIFVDAKLPWSQRRLWPVIVAAEDDRLVLAVAGLVTAEAARCKIGGRCHQIEYFQGDFPVKEGI